MKRVVFLVVLRTFIECVNVHSRVHKNRSLLKYSGSMSLRRKQANSRGTFLLVDGRRYDISNIVHESTERIPEEVTVMMRRPLWSSLYPSLSSIEQVAIAQEEDNSVPREERYRSSSSASSQSSVSDSSSFLSSGSSSTSTSPLSSVPSSHAESDHQSLTSSNSIPAAREENEEAVKDKRTGVGTEHVDPQTGHGAVHVDERRTSFTHSRPGDIQTGGFTDMKKSPGAVHVMDGPGGCRSEIDSGLSICWKHPYIAQKLPAQHEIPREQHFSSSTESLFYNRWNNGNQKWEDGDATPSPSQRVSASPSKEVENPHCGEKQIMVQLTDDLELPLHGAKETSRALDAGKMLTVDCIVCRATLRCIDIAQYVICPECKCVTPLETRNSFGGVGLGVLATFDRHFVGIS